MTTSHLPFESHKKFLSSLSKAKGEASFLLSTATLKALSSRLFALLLELLDRTSDTTTLANIQGENGSEIFFVQGTIKKSDTDHSDTTESIPQEIPFELKIRSKLKNSSGGSNYTFAITTFLDNQSIPLDRTLINDLLTNTDLAISTIRFSLEWLSPHYFSWIGFAPTIEDFFHLTFQDSTMRITVRYGGDNLTGTVQAPIKDVSFWQHIETAVQSLAQ